MSVADVNTPRRTSNRVTKGLERTAEIRISSGQLAGIPENYLGQIVFRLLPSIDGILFVEFNGWNSGVPIISDPSISSSESLIHFNLKWVREIFSTAVHLADEMRIGTNQISLDGKR